jgi:hypothetical protein
MSPAVGPPITMMGGTAKVTFAPPFDELRIVVRVNVVVPTV